MIYSGMESSSSDRKIMIKSPALDINIMPLTLKRIKMKYSPRWISWRLR